MAEITNMPRLSDTMEEGVIASWLKKVGDTVKPGDILAEVETDKATMELESYEEGVLLYVGVKEKDSVMRVLMEPINDEVSSLVFSEENISINDWSKFNTVFDQLAKRRTLKRVAARYIEKILEGRGVTYHVPESIIDSDSTAVTGSISNNFLENRT